MKTKKLTDMTNSTTLQQREKNGSVAYVLNFIGVIVGGTVAAASLAAVEPIGFFAGIAGVFFCLDALKANA